MAPTRTIPKASTLCFAWIAAARAQWSSVAQRWKSASDTLSLR